MDRSYREGLFMRLILSLMIVMFSASAVANIWQWPEPCRVDDGKTRCSLWPASVEALKELKVTTAGQTLELSLQVIEESTEKTASLVFVQVGLNSSGQQGALKGALSAYIDQLGSHQHTGIYTSDNHGLVNVAPLGTSANAIKHALGAMEFQNHASNVEETLTDLGNILGGAPMKRKSLYWVTTGASLTDAQQRLLKDLLKNQGVRLVVVHLLASESAQELSDAFPLLLNSPDNFLIKAYSASGSEQFKKMAGHNVGGGRIEINTAALCGPQALKFSARFGEQMLNHSLRLAYPPCSENQEQSSPSGSNQPDQEGTASSPEETPDSQAGESIPLQFSLPVYNFALDYEDNAATLLGAVQVDNSASGARVSFDLRAGNEADLFIIDAEGNLKLSSYGVGQIADAYDQIAQQYDLTVVATSASQVGESLITVRKAPAPLMANKLLMAVLIGGAVVLIILVSLLLRGRAKERPYAVLIEYSPQGERKHDLLKPAIKLGREPENDLVFQNDTVSGSHAVIKHNRDGSIVIVDLDSTNGTRVNGNEVSQHAIQSGDSIELGEYRLGIEVRPS